MSTIESLGSTQQNVATTHIVSELRKRVPGFDEINTAQEFVDWLSQDDPVSGLNRTVIVQDAYQKLDVERLVRLINMFLQETGFVPPSLKKAQRNEAVSEHVAPSTVADSSDLTTANVNDLAKKVWTQAEYIRVFDPRFVKEVGEERAAQLQAIADAAVAEGRIQL